MNRIASRSLFVLLFVGALFSIPASLSYAETGDLTVSVTPPLFQLAIGPGEFWASTLKIVNTNEYDVYYYATVVNFESSGEGGVASFSPVIEEFDDPELNAATLANWIRITKEPIFVPRGQSVEVPFEVKIPENASPGGHYAAILIGTKPPEFEGGGPTIGISSYVSSLMFVKIKGDVIEKARIREFVSEKTLYDRPEANFLLRFENLGTVHLRPQGVITIYNMWGKERGKVEINQKTNFGNVLPGTIRKFTFSWAGEFSPLDIGPYRAVVGLQYGDQVKQNVSATTYFWVVPIVPVAVTLFVFTIMVASATYLIRRYVRRVLELEATRRGVARDAQFEEPKVTLSSLTLPLREGVVDLKAVRFGGVISSPQDEASLEDRKSTEPQVNHMSVLEFYIKYQLFFVFLVFAITGGILTVWYFGETLIPARTFEITNVVAEEEPVILR